STARPGVGYLALRSGAFVVPVACHGTQALARRRPGSRPHAQMVFGAPIAFPRHPDGRPLNRRTVAAATQRIRMALAERAVVTADLVLFVVDGRTGATDTDLTVARTLRRAKRPVVLAVTKVDDERLEPDTAELWSLGLGEPFPVSGLHGRGSGDLLDAVLDGLPDAPREQDEQE